MVLSGLTGVQRISLNQAGSLMRKTIDEIKNAVFSMKKFDCPRPDGIPTAFYQHF